MICLEQGRRNKQEQAQGPTWSQKRRVETPRDRCQAHTTKHQISRHSEEKSSQRTHFSMHQASNTFASRSPVGRCCASQTLGSVQRAPGAGRDATPVPQWSTADIAGDDKDADSESLSKDSTVFQDTACRGQTWRGRSHTADRQRSETSYHELCQGLISASLVIDDKIACLRTLSPWVDPELVQSATEACGACAPYVCYYGP